MKIIVDEMPVFRDECPFCKMDFGEYICSRSDLECNIDMCDFLKPITDYFQNFFMFWKKIIFMKIHLIGI